jgi:phage major head subunit gpT-like protein
VLLAAFQAAPNPLKTIARQTTIADFRTKTTVKLSEWPRLEQVNEAGEVHYGSRGEAKEAYALKTYAKIFSLSRQALINDDLGAFADFATAAGRAAAETEAQVLIDLLTAASGVGPTLDDGVALFAAGHGNLAAVGTIIDVTNLAAARLAMRSQLGIDAKTPINATPRYLLVSATKETQAESVLAPLTPAAVSNVNPFPGKLELLVEARLTGNPWYLVASPDVLPVFEYAYLAGAPGPQLTSREGFDVLGMEYRVVDDFGAGVVDFRGIYRNAGA